MTVEKKRMTKVFSLLFLFKTGNISLNMKRWFLASLFFVLLSCIGHFYLAKRTYKLSAGLAQPSSICNINKTINCDQALLSPYAKIFDFSLSDFGLSTHLILAVLLLTLLTIHLSSFWKNSVFYLSSLITLSSIAMIAISLIDSLYCPICWSLYALSFLATGCLFWALRKELLAPWSFLTQALFNKSSYILVGAFAMLSIFIHSSFINTYKLKDQKEILSSIFKDWQTEPVIKLEPTSLLQKNKGGIRIAEFADFLCPSCQRVQPALKQFLENAPNVSFDFYVYPLDGACNPAISSKGSGLSCELSKAIVCAKEKSWEFHDFFFDKQSIFLSARGDKETIQKLFDEILNQTNLDKQTFTVCMQEESTLKKVMQSAKAGSLAGIDGTPAFFINGKRIRNHSFRLLIFNKIYQSLQSQ